MDPKRDDARTFQALASSFRAGELEKFQRDLLWGSGRPNGAQHPHRTLLITLVVPMMLLLGYGAIKGIIQTGTNFGWEAAALLGAFLLGCVALVLGLMWGARKLHAPPLDALGSVEVRVAHEAVSTSGDHGRAASIPTREIAAVDRVDVEGAARVRVVTHDGRAIDLATWPSDAAADECKAAIEREVERYRAGGSYRSG